MVRRQARAGAGHRPPHTLAERPAGPQPAQQRAQITSAASTPQTAQAAAPTVRALGLASTVLSRCVARAAARPAAAPLAVRLPLPPALWLDPKPCMGRPLCMM